MDGWLVATTTSTLHDLFYLGYIFPVTIACDATGAVAMSQYQLVVSPYAVSKFKDVTFYVCPRDANRMSLSGGNFLLVTDADGSAYGPNCTKLSGVTAFSLATRSVSSSSANSQWDC